jgi:predicted nucleic acid-binding protein
MAVMLRAPITGMPIATLMSRAFAILVADMVMIYDSLDVAPAEKLSVPLVMADESLVRRL